MREGYSSKKSNLRLQVALPSHQSREVGVALLGKILEVNGFCLRVQPVASWSGYFAGTINSLLEACGRRKLLTP